MSSRAGLPPGLQQEIEGRLTAERGAPMTVQGAQSAGGSSFHRSWTLDLSDGSQAFLKSNSAAPNEMFQREAEGLQALAGLLVGVLVEARSSEDDPLETSPVETNPVETNPVETNPVEIIIPRVLAVGSTNHPFLLLEQILSGSRPAGFSARFGRALARLHQASTGLASSGTTHESAAYGLDHDNFLGTTPQPNSWTDDWVEFWRRHRLGFQLQLARRKGLATGELHRLGDRLLDRLDELIGEPWEPPTLIHGDLWGGNYLVTADGRPALIDPAAYYGRREAELAMTRLFGGFDEEFERGYQEVWPLAPGAEERIQLYQLYHLLNHLNLFGGGYLDSCLRLLRRFA